MTRFLLSLFGVLFVVQASMAQALYTVTSPNGGENLTACNTMQVSYTKSATAADRQRIEISFNGGRTYYEIGDLVTGTASSGSISLPVPNHPTSRARIRVRDYDGGTAQSDVSDADFTISMTPSSAPFIITSPTKRTDGRVDTFASWHLYRLRADAIPAHFQRARARRRH